jgi:F0F1-type ATP synthase epsilon subunit
MLGAAILCVLPLVALAQEDLSRDAAKKRLDETEQQLQSSRTKEEGLVKDIAAHLLFLAI